MILTAVALEDGILKKIHSVGNYVKELSDSKVFCIAPWVHLHAWANGAVYPCCLSNSEDEFQFGNLNESTLDKLFNSKRIKQMRNNMLQNIPDGACTRCYENEKSGFSSMRNNLNKEYLKDNINLVTNTKPDGTVDDIKIQYWDIRFSNICNMKCRTCGPDFSTQWQQELNSTGENDHTVKKIRSSLLTEISDQIQYIKSVYFAGGEPLLMDEHWKFIEQIIEHGNRNINIHYQTNLSKLYYKKKSAIDLWNYFDRVTVNASLDAHGDLASYVRTGTDWKIIESNIKTLKEKCPNVILNVSCTVSVLNIHNIVDFYNYLVDNNYINPNNFEINPVMFPFYYKLDILPDALLKKYKNKIDVHIKKLSQLNINVDNTINNFQSLSNMLTTQSKYKSSDWDNFIKITYNLDRIRNQNVKDHLPELVRYIV